jgi:hypothetical protein
MCWCLYWYYQALIKIDKQMSEIDIQLKRNRHTIVIDIELRTAFIYLCLGEIYKYERCLGLVIYQTKSGKFRHSLLEVFVLRLGVKVGDGWGVGGPNNL